MTLHRGVIAALIVLFSVTASGAAPAPKMSAAQHRKEALALLARGRAASEQKDHERALAAFNEALGHAAGDPDILTELGVALMRTGRLTEARQRTQQAIARARKPAQRAAAEFNLGLIEEADWNDAAALAAYRRSLKLRPNPTVAEKQGSLAARVRGSTQLLRGPFPSWEALCEAITRRVHEDRDDRIGSGPGREVTCARKQLARITDGLPPPLEEVRVFVTVSRETGQEEEGPIGESYWGSSHRAMLQAAARTGGAWYLAAALAEFERGNHLKGEFKLKDASVKPFGPGGAPVVVIHFHATQEAKWSTTSSEEVAAIGVGPSGKPGILAPVTVVERVQGESKPKEEDSEETVDETRLDWSWQRGALEVTKKRVTNQVGEKKKSRAVPAPMRIGLEFP